MGLDALLEKVDIVDLASQFTDLEEKNGEFWGISPITYPPENTPSFSVRRETGSFYDFSSGVGGTAITLIQYCQNISKHEAIEWLKQYCDAKGIIQRPQLAACEVARRFSPPKTTRKESKTTILPDDYMDRYEKNEEKLAVWETEGISRASLDRFQVYYDGFSDRLVYPIRDPQGKIVNIGGRTLDPQWKKKKLRKYTYFQSWGRMSTIYGFAENRDFIKEKHEIILFEGCKSVLLADTWGIRNTGAILTSHLNVDQMKLLAKLGCHVVFALDKDVRIRDDRHIAMLKQYVNVEYLWDRDDLLEEKDSPVDQGYRVFQTLYERRLKWQ